jgi:hypothetical protein
VKPSFEQVAQKRVRAFALPVREFAGWGVRAAEIFGRM